MLNLWSVIGGSVTSLIKVTIDQKVMPNELKVCIVPMQKVKGSAKCYNLKPIKTLPIIEKVIKSVVYETLMNYVNDEDLLSQCQSGFSEEHCTESALQLVISEWIRIKDRGEGVIAAYLDYRRVFGTVNRDLLLKKLKNMYSITGAVYE